ncbi:serine/threonine-protein kinase [Parabacteroides pacaensis]|uniref:serine/threonine-protein kinase n=1 Tax=Parabacteroides pacaensis TaxID=2086575 RepID=UPI000D0FECEC|nr:serine/threonine-protein kinase [Parabacteroides pacaensis]
MMDNSTQIYQRNGDSRIYLQVMGQWYYYDTNSTPLGKGAMGTVYLGFSCNSNQRIAVKKVKDIYANNKMIRVRARQEASLSFSHPNLVQMIGLCEYNPNYGPIFVLSGYIAGITLESHVKEQLNHLPQEDRIEKISNELCYVLDALQYLHSRGVVHRDVKPSNIMIENGSVVKLMDLGIARLNGGNKYSSYGFIGTPQYAAPEQILRNSANNEINAQTDIYATGVTFYELLTGYNPFKADIEAEVLSRQISIKLPYDKKIPRSLYNVILKATEKNSNKRYRTAIEFKIAIMDVLQKNKTNIITDWIFDHRKLLSCIAVLLIFLIIIFVMYGHTY